MYLVFDIGGSFIKYAVIDKTPKIVIKGKQKTPRDSKKELLAIIKNVYQEYQQYQIVGIAISAPGLVDIENGKLVTSGIVTCLEGSYLEKEVSTLCNNLPVSLENDGKAAALCESWIGAAKDVDSCAVLVFGSGIGGGIVIDKQILRGKSLMAGEFSPLFIDKGDNNYMQFAAKASTMSIVRQVQIALQDDSITGEVMMQKYQEGHSKITKILEECFEYIAMVCYNIDVMVNPERICIGGGISEDFIFIEGIQKALDKVYQKAYLFRPLTIIPCQYNNDSNLYGALYTFKNKYSNSLS